MLTHEQIARLRKFADDDTKSIGRRLGVVDLLAGFAGAYKVDYRGGRKYEFRDVPLGTRPRREIIRLLRKILKSSFKDSKRVNRDGIETRLMFLQTGVTTHSWISRPTKERTPVSPPPGQTNALAEDIDEFLAKQGGGDSHDIY
jgi:hypothetical protein